MPMKRLFVTRSMAVAGLAAILLAPLAYAQRAKVLRVNVSFNFTAKGTACPDGEYFFKNENGTIDLSSAGGKIHLFLPVLTSIARSSDADDHLLAFDKVGDERFLSEVWLPGSQKALVSSIRPVNPSSLF
jgi:hypothetical protein